MASDVKVPPLHSRRVEAWVYVVINPLVESLGREILLLDRGNLTWRWYSKECEYIRPVSEYIDSSQWPNYEDFIADELNPGFKQRFEEHDLRVAMAASTATRFFEGLMQSGIFLKQVKDSVEKYESSVGTRPEYPGLDSMREDLPRYVAEYLINQTDVLPRHYMAHKFWVNYRHKFELSAHEFEPYQERGSFQALKQATGALKGVSKDLRLDLESHRQLLCRTYDIPAAPILVDKSHSTDASIV